MERMSVKIDYSKLTNFEINEMMANKIMGWTLEFFAYWKSGKYICMEGKWHPESDLNQAWKCEEELLKTVCDERYDDLLNRILVIESGYGACSAFHAPPRQRCIAMLMAMEEE
jgi:hypothetical protein